MVIVAIDLGKAKSLLCWYQTGACPFFRGIGKLLLFPAWQLVFAKE